MCSVASKLDEGADDTAYPGKQDDWGASAPSSQSDRLLRALDSLAIPDPIPLIPVNPLALLY